MLALLKDARARLDEAKHYRDRRVMEALSMRLNQVAIGDALGITRQAVGAIRDRVQGRAPSLPDSGD